MPNSFDRITRRATLLGLGASIAAPFIHTARAAGDWPTKPVRIIYNYAPGGAGDALSRPWAERLTRAFGQPFVVENRGGASGTIGAEAAAKATPDGYTFLFSPNSALNVVPQLRKVGYDVRKDLMPVARIGDIVGGFGIVSSLGITIMKDMVAYARQNPGKLIYGSAGLGTSTHMRIELIKLRAGVNIVHVPYRGSGDAMVDLLGGTIHMMNEIVIYPHVRAGKLKLLAVNNPTRHWDFPDVPTLTEAGFPNCDVPIWFSAWAPRGTPPEIIRTLNARIAELSRVPDTVKNMREIGFNPAQGSPDEVGTYFDKDWDANAMVIHEAKIVLS
jgi:tripartite-type tricarboxylate transporter receptor subunit TctC